MTLRDLLVRAFLLATLGCSSGPSETAAQSSAAQSSAAQPSSAQPATLTPILAWLDCVECSDVELKAVVALGEPAVLELRGLLLNGPTQDRLAAQRQHLLATYRSLKVYEQRRPARRVPLGEDEYVQVYQQKYILLNRSRAARALGAIGTAPARTALSEALKTTLPAELQADVERALKASPEGANPAVPNPDLANPDVANPDMKKPTPPKPPR